MLNKEYVNNKWNEWLKNGLIDEKKKQALSVNPMNFLEQDQEFCDDRKQGTYNDAFYKKNGKGWFYCVGRQSLCFKKINVEYWNINQIDDCGLPKDDEDPDYIDTYVFKWYSYEGEIIKFGIADFFDFWYDLDFKSFVVLIDEYYNDEDFDLNEYLVGKDNDTEEERNKRDLSKKTGFSDLTFEEAFNQTHFTKDMKSTYGCLIKSRLMHADIIRLLIEKGYIKTIKKKITMEDGTEFEVVNSGFIWVDEDYKTVGLSLSGNYVQKGKKRFKGMLNESDGRYGFNLKFCDKPDTIIFCEGCEDMISFCQLYSERVQHCHMVAMTGIKDETVEYYAERYPYAKLILAVDNDDAGKNFVKKIKKIYKDRTVIDYTEQFATKNPTLTFKDWNEVLINSKEDFKDSYLPFELLRKTDIDEKIDKMPKTEEKPLNQFTF